MATTLSVMEAWGAANSIYSAKRGVKALVDAFADDTSSLTENFSLSEIKDSAFLSGNSGAFIKSKTGFAVISQGKNIANKNEYLISIRGTASLFDGLTDGNIGLQLSNTGKMVHAGFNRTFADLEPQIQRYFAGKNPTMVHCVGHSLGGALASLTADWITTKGISKVQLYTFGSPRVGFLSYANQLTQNLDNGKGIYRVHHDNDFVSLVPLWPFVHVPQPGISCCLENKGFNTVSAHFMTSYLTSLTPAPGSPKLTWDALRVKSAPVSDARAIEKWLSVETVSILSARTLSLLGEAIQYIFKAAGIITQLGLISGITVLDKLSYAMEIAWKSSKEVAGWVEYLIKKILQITGQAIVIQSTLTAAFIRWVFQLLSDAVGKLVNLCLMGSDAKS